MEYPFDQEDIVKGSGYITAQCCGNSEIELGAVYAAEMGISLLNILVWEYRCSGGTDTANPAAGNRCSGTGIPHLLNCLLPASLLA